ncbi:hypothetical protein Tco_0009571 [Tanacetum coccineum]
MEVSRLSGMDNDLFTYEVEVVNIPYNSKIDDDSEDEVDDDMGYGPSDVAFIECLRSKSNCEVFRIDTMYLTTSNLSFQHSMEFNYLLKIDLDLLTKDIEGFKTYDDYKDDWIYEWNQNVPWVDENPWTNIGV